MKQRLVYTLSLIAGLTLTYQSHATLYAYEGFGGNSGDAILGSTGGTGWAEGWQLNNSTGTATFTSSGLGYTDIMGNTLTTSGNAGFFQGVTTANTGQQMNRAWSAGPLGTNAIPANSLDDGGFTWISMIVVRQGPTGTLANNAYGRGVNVTFDYLNNGAGNQKIAVGNASGNGQNTVGILSQGGNIRNGTTTFGASPAITNFIVLAIEHVLNGLDNSYMWVNPTLGSQPLLSTAQTNVLGLFDYTIDRIRAFVGGNASAAQPYGELLLDEVRVANTWADATPFTAAVPEPATVCLMGFGVLGLFAYRKRK